MVEPVRVALVGYGVGGRFFHAPFLEAAEGIETVAVVTRSPERRAQATADLPDARVVDDLAAAVALGVDAAVISTPPATRRRLVLDALAAGLAVVADKPFAPSADGARELAAAAEGRVLAVFHNRRWDADVRTLRSVLDSGELGEVERFTARMDEDGAAELGDSLLRDLGSHLVDQALWLFGPAASVFCELDRRGGADTGFALSIAHASGVRSHLSASKANRAVQKELRVLGTLGSYRSDASDVQAQASRAGLRPVHDPTGWGYEPRERWGALSTAEGVRPVPSLQGDYTAYYTAFAAAMHGEGPVPVTPAEAVAVAEVLDAAAASDERGQVVRLGAA